MALQKTAKETEVFVQTAVGLRKMHIRPMCLFKRFLEIDSFMRHLHGAIGSGHACFYIGSLASAAPPHATTCRFLAQRDANVRDGCVGVTHSAD